MVGQNSHSVTEFRSLEMEMELFSNVLASSLVKGKRSKRLRPWFSAEEQQGPWSCSESTLEDEHDSEDEEMTAHSLILLSHGASSVTDYVQSPTPTPTPIKRVMKKPKDSHSADSRYEGENKSWYKCKTCTKAFPSFQALGGHRASYSHISSLAHLTIEEFEQAKEKGISNNKMKVHECAICSRVFSSGQALGGHKRTHSTTLPPSHSFITETENEERVKLDLNMPAPLDETEDSSPLPFSTSHYNDYKLSSPIWWMNSTGKRFPGVYNGGVADEAERKVVIGQNLGLNPDLFMVAAVN